MGAAGAMPLAMSKRSGLPDGCDSSTLALELMCVLTLAALPCGCASTPCLLLDGVESRACSSEVMLGELPDCSKADGRCSHTAEEYTHNAGHTGDAVPRTSPTQS